MGTRCRVVDSHEAPNVGRQPYDVRKERTLSSSQIEGENRNVYFGGSGRSHSHVATSVIIVLTPMASHSRGEKKNNITAVAAIIVVASHFALRLTAPVACQSRIIGPMTG